MRLRILFVLSLALPVVVAAMSPTAQETNGHTKTAAAGKDRLESGQTAKNPATLAQLMRGVMFPNSNLIFSAQGKDPAKVLPAKNSGNAINPLEGTYGKWEAVENSSLVIVEVANLLTVPGRVCSNGRPVPTTNADWPALVQGLQDAGMKSYRAAQTKDQDKITDAADALTTACSNCHAKYRDKPKLEDRCR
jgi:hypothetical protein